MYNCHIRFYLIGRQQELWEQIRAVSPLKHFTHTFTESSLPKTELLAQADVIFADLLDMDIEQILPVLTGGKRPGAELILLAGRSQTEELAETGAEITDLWVMPMSRAEIRFRFERWMQTYKLEKDYWQAEQLLDVSIGDTPQPIRYKSSDDFFEIFSTFLADNVDDVYMMINESGTAVEFVTPNVERVLGVPAETVLNNIKALGLHEYTTGREMDMTGLTSLEPGMELETMETKRIHRKTGEEKWFRESVYCVSVQDAKKIVVYISDRTRERKNRDALCQALEIAQVANKAKSAFLRNVSHDIRTPMNAIMGFAALLREEADSPEHVLEYTEKISDASRYLLGLINNVLDMNKIESGIAVLDITELDLAELVDEVDAIIRLRAEEKKQSFEIAAISLTNKHLLGDRLRIRQILTNILSNAVEYTPNGGEIKMWIEELPQVDKNYSRIRFTVSDNGPGMSEEYQKVIFEPFTREQSAAWNQMHGTGLGMAITKSLIELMNGSIKVTSRPGEGSTFVAELELRMQDKEDVRQTPDTLQQEAAASDMESAVKGRRVLVVDDIDVNRVVLEKILKTLGAECDTAKNGQEAVEKFFASGPDRYDLILMDVQMPCLDGHGATRAIRAGKHPAAQTIPIIAMSANAFVDDIREALEAGMDAHVAKPIVLSQLDSAIREVLGRRRIVYQE